MIRYLRRRYAEGSARGTGLGPANAALYLHPEGRLEPGSQLTTDPLTRLNFASELVFDARAHRYGSAIAVFIKETVQTPSNLKRKTRSNTFDLS